MTETPGAAPTTQPSGERGEKDTRMWGMFCHLAALCGFVIPLGSIIGPLVVWLIKRDEYPFVNRAIYLTPPPPRGCSLVRSSNGTGGT